MTRVERIKWIFSRIRSDPFESAQSAFYPLEVLCDG